MSHANKTARFHCPRTIGGPKGLIKPGADCTVVVDYDTSAWLDERIEAGVLPAVSRVAGPVEPADTDKVVPINSDAAVDDGAEDDGDEVESAPEPEPAKPARGRGRKAKPGASA